MEIVTSKVKNNITANKRVIQKSVPQNAHPPVSSNISFKGVETVAKNTAKTLFTESEQKIINIFGQHYGNVGDRLGKKVAKLATSSEVLKKGSRFTLEKGALSIKEKGVGQALVENLLFPFVTLPLYAASWVVKKAQSIPSLKDKARHVYNKPILRIPRKLNELDAKTDMIKGIYEKTSGTIEKFAKKRGLKPEFLVEQLNKIDDNPNVQPVIKEANEYVKESLYKVSNKFFDKHTGNFNTAYERPLNRIVTGLIPVAFLANDAYNLSVLCGDSKDVSKKEARERRKQEISRVFTTAYIQLLTFGAFTRQVNTIPWFTPLTSAATVLFSETSSRKRLGKPIFFVNKEKAKEYNKKEQEKAKLENGEKVETKQQVSSQQVAQVKTDYSKIKDSSAPKIFTSFKSTSKEEKVEKPKKALINAKTFKNGVAILVTGGFALSFLKNSSYTKNTKLVKGIKSIGEFCKNKIYNPLVLKDFEMSKTEFDRVMTGLKESGCKEIAQGHEFIKNKYGKTVGEVIKMTQGKLSSAGAEKAITSSIKKLSEKGINLSEKEVSAVSSAVKVAVSEGKTAISEFKFQDVAKQACEIIEKKKVNLKPEELVGFSDDIASALSENAKSVFIQMDKKAKPFVDIVIQPFKFVLSAAQLPFKIASTAVKMAVSPVEKKAAKALVGEAELSKMEKGIHKVVTEIFGEKQAKSGKISQTIFANAMEQFTKRTKPYTKAKEVLDNAVKNGASASELAKAKQVLEDEKLKLLKYVNTAVEKSFNGVTQSSNKNTDLAMMSKLASSAVTSAFLVADNYNMVMIKSNGEDKEGAKETAIERIIQRVSALFYQTLFINWFNSTFRATYNSSLKGMAAVAIPNTLTTEVLTRKSIGMPVGRKSFEELQANEEKNENRKGFLGKYFKFMRLLTGKKPLKDRMPKNKTQNMNQVVVQPKVVVSKPTESTNLIEKYSK